MADVVSPKNDIRKRSFVFSLLVIKFCETLPRNRAVWIIVDQLVRSATSIGANVNEAKGASSRLEFKRYYEIALKSANETEYWLNLLKETGFSNTMECEKLLIDVLEIQKMLASAILKLKKYNI